MDFEDEVGVSGKLKARRDFREDQRHVQRWRHGGAEVCGACRRSSGSLPKSRGPTSVAEEAGKEGWGRVRSTLSLCAK